MPAMKVLFIHQNFPAQYRHIALYLARQGGHGLVSVSKTTAGRVRGVLPIYYHVGDTPARSQHPHVTDFETKLHHGELVQDIMVNLKKRGYVPDIILAHPGWGEAMFTKDVFPDTPRLDYCEFYYNAMGADVNFDPEQPPTDSNTARIRARNASALMALESCDWGYSPTAWQRSQYPAVFQPKISVLHDGIDTALVRPDKDARLSLGDGTVVRAGDEVVTFVARNLEPYRGFHQFVRAAKLITERRPRVRIIVVGGDGVSYGRKLPPGQTYRELMLKEVPLDLGRVHFVGKLPYDKYLRVLQVSGAHIYLTVPFVLSWSMLESMAAGCLLIGSDTPPVAEVIRDGENGLLVDFFSPRQIADAVDRALDGPETMVPIREQARKMILERYALSLCLPRHIAMIKDLAEGRTPPPAMAADAATPPLQNFAPGAAIPFPDPANIPSPVCVQRPGPDVVFAVGPPVA